MPTTGTSKLKKMKQWTAAALIAALLTAWAVPTPAAEAAIGPLLLKSPQEIEFATYNGVTQMYIADTGNNRVLRADPDGLVNLIIDRSTAMGSRLSYGATKTSGYNTRSISWKLRFSGLCQGIPTI